MKKGLCILGSAILCTFLMIIGCILLGGGIAEKSILMIFLGFAFFAISIVYLIKTRKKYVPETQDNATPQKRLTYKEKVLQNREKALKSKEKMYRKMKYKLTFVSGLPLIEGALCKVVSTNDKIIIEGQGTSFELKKEKITSITIEKNITKHTQAVSSAGGALAGAMAFGVVGAAIGGRTTARNIKSLKHYIVITYCDSEDNVKYIIFDHNNKGTYLVEDFKTFNKNNIVKKTVEID